jgi:hypothetical protein
VLLFHNSSLFTFRGGYFYNIRLGTLYTQACLD